MNQLEKDMHANISRLLKSQRLAVLSTQNDGQPYSSLMAYGFTPDLKNLLVATSKATRKHQNIVRDSRVSLLIDNRENSEEDFHAASALTVLGKAEPLGEGEYQDFSHFYLEKHPYMESFLMTKTTAFFRIRVYQYLLVSRFQNVLEYTVQDESEIFATGN
jgi:nitroimidazol reductase NimA-like FMN-containing flavoprotein (pyridoxamine 5'-phosphate oxidase superfamily)